MTAGLGRFKPYPEYKDSGVKWLGKIPGHWRVARLRDIASIQLSNVDKKTADGELPIRLCNYTDVYYHNRISKSMDFMIASATRAQVTRFSLRRNDVLITKDSESWTDIAVSSVVEEDLPDVLCGYHMALIRPDQRHLAGPFLARACSAIGPRDQFQIAANGITRFGLTGESIRAAVFMIPPIAEQIIIAECLNQETAKIDALIAKKARLIELLQEKRTALITHAVTKGLNPNAPTKASFVEWIGDIPAHWEMKRLQDIVESLQTGPFGSQLHASEYIEGGRPLVNPTNMQNSMIVPDQTCTVDDRAADRLKRHTLAAGDIVVARRGQLGRCALVTESEAGWLCGTGSLRVRLKRKIANSDFVMRSISTPAIRDWLTLQSVGSTMQNLNTVIIGRISVALPPVEEQQTISKFIYEKLSRQASLIARIETGIERSRELRSALISAAVTGKIDVRQEKLL